MKGRGRQTSPTSLNTRVLLLLLCIVHSAAFLQPSPAARPLRSDDSSGLRSCIMSTQEQSVAEAAAIIRKARRIVVFTGAGMSADSGIAVFT